MVKMGTNATSFVSACLSLITLLLQNVTEITFCNRRIGCRPMPSACPGKPGNTAVYHDFPAGAPNKHLPRFLFAAISLALQLQDATLQAPNDRQFMLHTDVLFYN
jgi:hypothetical protein